MERCYCFMEKIYVWEKKGWLHFACYNMAIASETHDNIDAALEWAAKSFLLNNDEYTEKYINILENRKKQKELINSQF